MRFPDKNGGKDRRATFDDVGGHNVTTKTILGARVRQEVGVPHGAHHRRILEGEKKRGMREWSRSENCEFFRLNSREFKAAPKFF